MHATDGDAISTSQTNQSSSLKSPEIIHLSAIEHLLHNAAQRRGQGEGAMQASAALKQAAAHYLAQPTPDGGDKDLQHGIAQALSNLASQFATQGSQCQREQNVLLGKWIMARNATTPASKVPPPLPVSKVPPPTPEPPPVRVGWAIRAWRATAVPLWCWAFAK